MITSNPKVMLGKPCIEGTRITVESVLEKLAAGETRAQILEAYPHLTDEGISAALEYAARSVALEVFHPLAPHAA